MKKVGIGLLGLGTVGQGVANIISQPKDRHPLVGELELVSVAVRNLKRKEIYPSQIQYLQQTQLK